MPAIDPRSSSRGYGSPTPPAETARAAARKGRRCRQFHRRSRWWTAKTIRLGIDLAQQLLESGGTRPHELTSGWLGRALAASGQRGMALQTAVPLLLRGPGEVDTWAPSALPDPSVDLVARVQRMYGTDPALAQALERARALRAEPAMNDAVEANAMGAGGPRGQAVALARRAGEFLSLPDGPQAAVLEIGGWDSHANQV
jgi:uncharacterized protein (DUF1501 family)